MKKIFLVPILGLIVVAIAVLWADSTEVKETALVNTSDNVSVAKKEEKVIPTDAEILDKSQALAERANLTGDDLKRFQNFTNTILEAHKLEKELREKGYDTDNPSLASQLKNKEPDLYDRHNKILGLLFGQLMGAYEQFRKNNPDDYADIASLQSYATFAIKAKEAITRRQPAEAAALVEKTKKMINVTSIYQELAGLGSATKHEDIATPEKTSILLDDLLKKYNPAQESKTADQA